MTATDEMTVVPAMALNTTAEFQEYVRWEASVVEDKSWLGCLWRCLYHIWRASVKIEPLWQIVAIAGTSAGVQFASNLMHQDLERAAFSGFLAGVLMGLLLWGLWWAAFHYGKFVDPVTFRYFRNEFHASIVVAYVVVLVMVGLVIGGIYAIDTRCNTDPSTPCDLKHVMIG